MKVPLLTTRDQLAPYVDSCLSFSLSRCGGDFFSDHSGCLIAVEDHELIVDLDTIDPKLNEEYQFTEEGYLRVPATLVDEIFASAPLGAISCPHCEKVILAEEIEQGQSHSAARVSGLA